MFHVAWEGRSAVLVGACGHSSLLVAFQLQTACGVNSISSPADQHWLTVAAQLFVLRYGLTGHTFGPASAYTSLALFNLLRMPLAFLPIMITSCINALVALTRIGDFLQKPESGLDSLRKAAESTPAGHVKVRLHAASCLYSTCSHV